MQKAEVVAFRLTGSSPPSPLGRGIFQRDLLGTPPQIRNTSTSCPTSKAMHWFLGWQPRKNSRTAVDRSTQRSIQELHTFVRTP